ncbi:unnamed protein product [Urochloa humidicola]
MASSALAQASYLYYAASTGREQGIFPRCRPSLPSLPARTDGHRVNPRRRLWTDLPSYASGSAAAIDDRWPKFPQLCKRIHGGGRSFSCYGVLRSLPQFNYLQINLD